MKAPKKVEWRAWYEGDPSTFVVVSAASKYAAKQLGRTKLRRLYTGALLFSEMGRSTWADRSTPADRNCKVRVRVIDAAASTKNCHGLVRKYGDGYPDEHWVWYCSAHTPVHTGKFPNHCEALFAFWCHMASYNATSEDELNETIERLSFVFFSAVSPGDDEGPDQWDLEREEYENEQKPWEGEDEEDTGSCLRTERGWSHGNHLLVTPGGVWECKGHTNGADA